MEVVFMILTSFEFINSIALVHEELAFNPKELYINSEILDSRKVSEKVFLSSR